MIELNFSIYSLLISVAWVIAVTFVLLLLFSRRINQRADRFLALFLLIIALWNASILIIDLHLYRYAAGVIWIPISFTLALGPCFYFYVRYMTDFEFDRRVKTWPHFIPVVFEVSLFFIEVYQGIPQHKGYFQTETYLFFEPIVTFFAIVSFMVYGYFARLRIKNYHHWVSQNYSNYHRYNLKWLSRFSILFLMLLTLWLGYFLVDYFLFDYQLSFYEYYPFHLFLAVLSIWLSAEAFVKPDVVYSDENLVLKEKNNTTIIDEVISEKAQWLQQEIEQNLLYLDSELSLKSLAEYLDIHPNYASKVFNEGLQQTFSDCINQYRVNAVVKKLKDDDNDFTLLAIALDCGFNSKTTFNRVFKKHLGKTPAQYRSEINSQ